VVTGASTGIGRATALALARTGASVGLVCRGREHGDAIRSAIERTSGNFDVRLLVADLSSQRAIRGLAAEIARRFDRVDVLINNAGLFNPQRRITEDGLEETFAVNHLACFLLTNLLRQQLEASAPARVVNVASDLHERGYIDFSDLQLERGYTAMRAYCASKLANVLFTFALARRLQERGVAANCLHPGWVRSDILRHTSSRKRVLTRLFARSPRVAARDLVEVATSAEFAGVSGRYFVKCREAPSSTMARDEALQEHLWEVSARLSGLGQGT
jgi:NAD(P)-dependent dehydrogenase (short-subunit alcohol dehydrogenase family)